jgi:hypothetical protein
MVPLALPYGRACGMVSQPEKVADFILKAVTTLNANSQQVTSGCSLKISRPASRHSKSKVPMFGTIFPK